MKKLILFLTLLVIGCNKGIDDPLTIPPNYNEMPDVNHPEEPKQLQKEADIEKLKDLLLKSE